MRKNIIILFVILSLLSLMGCGTQSTEPTQTPLEIARNEIVEKWNTAAGELGTTRFIEDIYKQYPDDEVISNIYFYCIADELYGHYEALGKEKYLDQAMEYAEKIDPAYDGELADEIHAFVETLVQSFPVEDKTETKVTVTPTEAKSEPVNIVLLDADGMYVEFRGIEEYSTKSLIISLYIENNRDSDIYFSLRDVRFNDCVVSLSNNGIKIPADSKYLSVPQFDLVIGVDELAAYDIDFINDLRATLHISTSFAGDVIYESPISVEIGKTVNSSVANEELGIHEVVLNTDGIYVEYRGIKEDSSESWILNLYVENNRDSEIYLSLRNNRINKFNVDLSNNGITIPANSKYLASPNYDLIIKTDSLAAYGITSIDELDFTLYISTSLFGECISEADVSIKH